MTTAHRPTWAPAVGGEEQGGSRWFKPSIQTSAKNLPGHTKLKFRQTGQNSEAELQHMDLKAELEAKERKHFAKSKGMIEFEGVCVGGGGHPAHTRRVPFTREPWPPKCSGGRAFLCGSFAGATDSRCPVHRSSAVNVLLERPVCLLTARVDERQRDLKLLETALPDGQAKPLVPKAVDADDEDPDESESSSDEDDVSSHLRWIASGPSLRCTTCTQAQTRHMQSCG
jgi:hypothetical protein